MSDIPNIPNLPVSTAVTPTDHGQIVVLAAWLCFTAGVLLTGVRAYIRWPLNTLAGNDDFAYAISTVFAIVQTAVTINAVRNGFGRSESELGSEQAIDVAKAIYATDLIFLLSIWTGKLSVSFLFARLAKESNKSRLGWALTGLVATFSLISLLSVAIRPDAAQPWIYKNADVSAIVGRWAAAGVLSIVFDLVVTGMTMYLVWDLHTDKSTKSLVITAFALRLPMAGIPTIVRLITIGSVRADDFSFSYSLPEAMTQLEMYANLIATTLPCLRLFLTAWNTSFMDIRLEEIDNDAYREHVTTLSGSGSASASRSGGMSKNSKSRASRPPQPRAAWAPSSGRSKAFVETGNRSRDDDAASDNSEAAIVVKRTIDVSEGARN